MQFNLLSFRCKRGRKIMNKNGLCEVGILHIFVGFISNSQIIKMTSIYARYLRNFRLISLLCILLSLSHAAQAQWDDWGSGDDEEQATDSTDNDDDDWGGGFGWGDEDLFGGGSDDKGTPPKPLKKYERIDHIPVDSLTKLITYTAVHDVEDECDYCYADSLYWRAKEYLLEKFGNGKKFPKSIIIEDTENQRILLSIKLPMNVQINPHSTRKEGEYEFRFQLWIRDYAYKYKFTNFVHLEPVVGGKPSSSNPVYMEYYLKNQRKVRQTDMFLLAMERDMTELIEGLVKVMKDPVTIDIDEEDF